MESLRLRTRVRQIGGELVITIPRGAARKADIQIGTELGAALAPPTPEILGFAKDLYDGPFDGRGT